MDTAIKANRTGFWLNVATEQASSDRAFCSIWDRHRNLQISGGDGGIFEPPGILGAPFIRGNSGNPSSASYHAGSNRLPGGAF